MCQHPVNMRKGIDSLFNLIQAESPLSPMSGDVFVFFSKNRQSVKLLRWDTDGFLLYQKRLERGSFEMPRINPSTGYYELSWETFSFIMSGVSLEASASGNVIAPASQESETFFRNLKLGAQSFGNQLIVAP